MRPLSLVRCLVLALLCLWLGLRAPAWVYEPSPFENGHLVIAQPAGFTDAAGKAAAEKIAGEYFGAAVKVAGPVACRLPVKHAGRYQLWARVLEGKPQAPLTVELVSGANIVLKGVINDGPGAPGTGGMEAFQAYRNEAVERNPEGGKDPGDDLLDGGGGGIGDFLNEINQDVNPELRWINANRIENVNAAAPYYWWKAGEVELTPGTYTLRVSGGPGSLNAAFLATAPDLTYPFGGDLDIPPASYIRFRVDKLPRGGLNLSAAMRIHANPHFGTSTGYFAPDRMLEKPGDPLKETGYTAWYSLQDLEYAPGFGAGTGHLVVNVPAGAQGATQFAVFPHGDQVLREFAWDEPEGTNISLLTDFKTYLHKLRTFRDHAREHYEYALAGSNGRLFPPIRGPIYLQPNGGAKGIPGDYAEKSIRLLGVNLAAAPHDADVQRRFDFKAQGGNGMPELLPFDDAKARAAAAEFYKNMGRELDEQTVITQLADEPGEIATLPMSAPLWRFYQDEKDGPKWVDHVGGSELVTKKLDYENCVLEGKVIKQSGGVGFKVVGIGEDGKPRDYVDWWLGNIPWSDNNMRVSRDGKPVSTMKKPEAAISTTTPSSFKVILDGNSAAMVLNGKLLYYFDKVPTPAGFAIYGPEKTLTQLVLRSPKADERNFTEPEMADPDMEGMGGLEIDDDIEPWTTTRPLEQFVREDWAFTGGMPEAQAGFRAWLQGYGVQPDLFGKKTWDDVTMMTVKALAQTPEEKRLYYWSRKYAGYLTPRLFALSAEAVRAAAPNKDIWAFTGLSGHSLYFPSAMPMDMFQLAQYDGGLMPGVSDAMSMGGWRWDSHESVAFSVAPFNGGARQYGPNFGKPPLSLPMMHCMWPNEIRAFTQIANNVKYQSYWCWGPEYNMTEWYWSEDPGSYEAVASIAEHCALVDDVIATGVMRDSRVAELFSMSSEYWGGQTAFTDKRPAFLALSHEYFKPYLVNEDQIARDGALDHYDALYVLDPHVSAAAQAKIEAFVKNGGLLWTQADAFTKDEYNAPSDFLQRAFGLTRTFTEEGRNWTMAPAAGETAIHKETVPASGVDKVTWDGATVRASFGDGRPAWLEKAVGKGRVVYVAFRGGHNYGAHAVRPGGVHDIWSDIAREPLVLPLKERKVDRELIVNQPSIMASPLTNENGTVIVLYNLQGAAAKGLQFSLKEATKPVSVQYYNAEMQLADLPFTYENGRAVFTLPELPRENMILVRSKPAPKDDRIEKMRLKTVDLLKRAHWEDISAGAWYAGFYPEWKMADGLIPLLAHEHSMVRRQAAESLGRLGHAPAANALAAQIAKETDPHALGDMLYALAQLNDPRFPTLAQEKMSGSNQPHVRKQCLRGAQLYLAKQPKLDDKLKAFGTALFELGDADLDRRVYSEAAPVLGFADPQRCLALWKESYAGGDTRHRDALTAIVAKNDALIDAALKGMPADANALIALAGLRADPRLATALTARLDEVAKAGNWWTIVAAAGTQADPAFAKALFARRNTLPDGLKPYVTTVLERTFNARLGNDAEAWEVYLKK
ncbi:MAG: hypothetical protein ACYC6A_14940 [Armatimonadota bacterium]